MNTSAREEYLAHQVLTATPERLQLMLIEAAASAAQRAQTEWQNGWSESVSTEILRAQRIVSQILSRLAVNGHEPLVAQVASVYGFIYRGLIAAHVEQNSTRLADAVRVLEVERETWRQVSVYRVDELATSSPAAHVESMVSEGRLGFSFEA